MARSIPHLTDTESIRAEAAAEHGPLDDAGTIIQTWHANLDPNLEATALKKVNVQATEEVLASLEEDGTDSIVHQKLAEELGDDHGLTVVSAAVRGHALSVVAMDDRGNPKKLVVPWDDKFESVGLSEAEKARRAVAVYEGKSRDLGKEGRAEIERRVAEVRAEMGEQMQQELAKLREEVLGQKVGEPAETVEEDAKSKDGDDNGGGGNSVPPKSAYPTEHKALDKLAKSNGVEFEKRSNVESKIKQLRSAGVKPA